MVRFKDFLIDMNNDMALAVGNAILSFNQIESLLYEYIDILYGDDLIDLIGHQSIRSRVNILKKMIKSEGKNDQQVQNTITLLNKVEPLFNTRNAIAHNPWEIYFSAQREEFVSSIFKYIDNKYSLDLKEVIEFTEKANKFAGELKSALDQFRREGLEKHRRFR